MEVDVDGRAVPGNNAPAGFDARIYSYGLRNVQGIALRPAGQPSAGQADTTKHGPNHSDEVTALPATRWRSLVQGPDGALWGSSDDGRIQRVAPH